MVVELPSKAIPEDMHQGLISYKGRREGHEVEAFALSEACPTSEGRGLYSDRLGFFALSLEASLMP